jgi:hypothetical protein
VKCGAGSMKPPPPPFRLSTDIQSFQQSADVRLPRHKSLGCTELPHLFLSSRSALPMGAELQSGMWPSHRPPASFPYWHQHVASHFQYTDVNTWSNYIKFVWF